MKKSLAVASLLLIGATTAMAGKVGDSIVGVEFGAMHTNSTATVTNLTNGASASVSGSDNTSYEAIKLAKYYDFGRVGAVLGHGNSKDGVDSNYIGLSYDYMFYSNSKFTPFIGASLSYAKATAEGEGFSIDETGINYGAEVGLVYDISKHMEFEIGARFLASNMSGDDTQTINGTPIKVEIDVDNIQQYYFGLNYKF
jgi:outer membrane protein W